MGRNWVDRCYHVQAPIYRISILGEGGQSQEILAQSKSQSCELSRSQHLPPKIEGEEVPYTVS